MKRTLITGATGFVGANLARRLLSEGHQVHLLVRPNHAGWRIDEIADRVKIHQFIPGEPRSIEAVFEGVEPEWVFHLAAHGAYSWQTDVDEIARTNFLFTVHLVEAALKVGFEALVNTGSSSEYGSKDHAPAEDEPVEPNSYYAVTKASATMFCRFAAARHSVNIPTLRLYSVFGPYEEANRLIPNLVAYGLAGRFPVLVDPSTPRDFVFVDDVCDAYLLAAGRSAGLNRQTDAAAADEESGGPERKRTVATPGFEYGAIYNVGSGKQTTLKEVVETAREILSIKAEPEFGSMPNRAWDTAVWVSDNRKIARELHWRAKHDLRQGLEKTIEWFKTHPHHLDMYRKKLALTGR